MNAGKQKATITEIFEQQAKRSPLTPAFSVREHREWKSLTWEEASRQVQTVADGFRRLGLERGDRIGICGPPCLKWQVAELAAFYLGAVVVGIEPHATADQLVSVLRISGIRFLVADDVAMFEKLPPADQHKIEVGVLMADDSCADALPDTEIKLRSWHDLLRTDVATKLDNFRIAPADPATLVFTSGTTGTSKAIEYSHEQLAVACHALCRAFPELTDGGKYICWLPMAHMFQRMMNYVAMAQGGHVFFQEDPREIIACLKEVKPEFFIAVPRFYEKLHEGILAKLASSGRPMGQLVRTAVRIGMDHARRQASGERTTLRSRAAFLVADRIVLQRIRNTLGGQLRYMMTGSAPIAPQLLEFFQGLGLLVLEAYGVSENAVPMAVNCPQAYRFGSVGRPLPENKIQIASDGEILVSGPGVFRGYLGDDSTQEHFTSNGAYKTGDLGHFDNDGFLFLTGRKKDIIKTSTGRRISPTRIEQVYQQCPLVEHVIVVGDGRKHLAALVTQASDAAELQEMKSVERNAAVLEHFQCLDRDLQPHEQVRAVVVLPTRLSISGGELTPSLKLRRNVICERYADAIDSLYLNSPDTLEHTDPTGNR